MNKSSYQGNYYTKRSGYIIEGLQFPSKKAAHGYLVRSAYMMEDEAEAYLDRLFAAFCRRVNAEKEVC